MSNQASSLEPSERLLRSARRRLAVFTLLLVAALVAVVGITTALVASSLMRDNVDRTLRAAAVDRQLLHELSDDEDDFEISAIGSSDTFVLLVDDQGKTLRNPSDISLAGMPDMAAVEAAAVGEDLRDGRYGDTDVRLLTTRITDMGEDGVPGDRPAFLQVGFVLTLQNEQERQLFLAVLGVALLGLAGAAVVTVLVTRRALVPIRAAFATERRFVAAASHELRTPVAVIRSSAEILQREDLVAAEGEPLVEDVIGEADRLGRLVGDLLALASAETGAVAVETEPRDLRPWFVNATRRAGALAAADGVDLAVKEPAGDAPIVVAVDIDRLEQVLHILIDNASRHAPNGSVVTVALSASAASGKARLAVSDDGPGIPPEDRERIFEPFTRVRGEKRSSGGTGLGLAIARQLATDHDAELRVADTAPPGATIELILPLVRQA